MPGQIQCRHGPAAGRQIAVIHEPILEIAAETVHEDHGFAAAPLDQVPQAPASNLYVLGLRALRARSIGGRGRGLGLIPRDCGIDLGFARRLAGDDAQQRAEPQDVALDSDDSAQDAARRGLDAVGVRNEVLPDGLRIEGGPIGGGIVDSHGDHRIAMSFAIASLRAAAPIEIRDVANVATSFPGFGGLARSAGLNLHERP